MLALGAGDSGPRLPQMSLAVPSSLPGVGTTLSGHPHALPGIHSWMEGACPAGRGSRADAKGAPPSPGALLSLRGGGGRGTVNTCEHAHACVCLAVIVGNRKQQGGAGDPTGGVVCRFKRADWEGKLYLSS